jgi:hypothetical protein
MLSLLPHAQYATGVRFNPSAHNLDGLMHYQTFQIKNDSCREIETLKPVIGIQIKQQVAEQLVLIPAIVSRDQQPKDKDDGEDLPYNHEAWRCRAVDHTCIVYTDKSQAGYKHYRHG